MNSPSMAPGACATLACMWEAMARKPGNVHRGADFEDVTFADFLASAALIGPILADTPVVGVGKSIYQAVEATKLAVASNTNLGTLLLIAPMTAATTPLANGVGAILQALDDEDTQFTYRAIAAAQPGGLGEVDEGDVNAQENPGISILEAMQLAAERDLVARQYTNNFGEVFQTANWLQGKLGEGMPLEPAIIDTHLRLMAEFPDSLIARKCGPQIAQEASDRAAHVLEGGDPLALEYKQRLGDLDFWLRSDGHRRNPGTSADFIAAGLFVLLREGRIRWPATFYTEHD